MTTVLLLFHIMLLGVVRGRPKNQKDDDLCLELQAAMTRLRLSGAALAQLLGVSPATLSRSLVTGRFSRRLAGASRRWLTSLVDDDPEAASISLVEALQILRNFDRNLPAVFKALSMAANER